MPDDRVRKSCTSSTLSWASTICRIRWRWASGPPDALAARFQTGRTLALRLIEPHAEAEAMFDGSCVDGTVVVDARARSGAFIGDDRAAAELLRGIIATGALVGSFGVEESDLEDIMIRMGAREVT